VAQLLLVIEVLSPTTARYDRQLKRVRYQREGVPEYWIVDIESRQVERWRPNDEKPEIVVSALDWQPEGQPVICTIDLDQVFREAE
jgi:Uma2 family endonuclease